jgi:putative copper resistance protein D
MGDMFWWVSHGKARSAMPAFGGVLIEKDRWNLINYVMALSLGYQARLIGPRAVSGFPWLPAIDFSLPEEDDPAASLISPRGASSKLLILVYEEAGLAKARDLLEKAAALPNLVSVMALPERLQDLRGALPADAHRAKVIIDASARILPAWMLYRRTLQHPDFNDSESDPAMMAFLIDRFGFVRARWRSDENAGVDPARFAADVRSFEQEPDIAGPDIHLH